MVQKARSMVRKLDIASDSRSLWPAGGNDAGLPSPTSPLDRAAPSPRVWRHRDAGGVGLAILAALEGQPGSPAARVSTPIAIASPRRAAGHGRLEVSELGCSGRCATSFCGGASVSDGAAFRVADFLASCHLCRRRLDGKDIYMYRGEKAFCSMECRYQQIVSDEYQEKDKCAVPEMPSKAAAASEIAGSPYAGGQIFFTGIVAA